MDKLKEVVAILWGDVIPVEDVDFVGKSSGRIRTKSGWIIRYFFGIENDKQFIEIYACHRMTDDRHYRIYEDGTEERREIILPYICYPANCTAEREREIEEAYFSKNREIHARLEKLGLV